MSRRPRRKHSSAFKSKVTLAAIKGEQTITELSQKFDVQSNQITQWKNQLLDHASTVFEGGSSKGPTYAGKLAIVSAPTFASKLALSI